MYKDIEGHHGNAWSVPFAKNVEVYVPHNLYSLSIITHEYSHVGDWVVERLKHYKVPMGQTFPNSWYYSHSEPMLISETKAFVVERLMHDTLKALQGYNVTLQQLYEKEPK